MPTILSHPVVPLAIGVALGKQTIPPALLAMGIVGSMLPDLDALSFWLGIAYHEPLGHRGITHSLLFAALAASLGALWHRRGGGSFACAFAFLFVAVASHGLLDALTNGGLGIAFLWPWTSERFFAPIQLIEVSPIGVNQFLSVRGLEVLRSECLWLWLPAVGVIASIKAVRRLRRRANRSSRLESRPYRDDKKA